MKVKHCFSNYIVDLELKKDNRINLYETFLKLKESGYLNSYEPVTGFNSIVFFVQECFRFEIFSSGKIRVTYWKEVVDFMGVIKKQISFIENSLKFDVIKPKEKNK